MRTQPTKKDFRTIPLPEDHPDRKVLEATALGCPVHHSVHADIDKPVAFVWGGK